MSKLTLVTEGDKHVVVTRRFTVPPEAVYRAHTEPRLIQKWLLGPDGWTMPACVCEARPGGKIRYEWADGKGGGFYLTGEFVELVAFSRSFTWNACIFPLRVPTITSKPGSSRTGAGR